MVIYVSSEHLWDFPKQLLGKLDLYLYYLSSFGCLHSIAKSSIHELNWIIKICSQMVYSNVFGAR